jgi:nucleoside-specific outer membrane channel protein Tsx
MMREKRVFSVLCGCLFISSMSYAFDWSDSAVSWRHGNSFREPFNSENIQKDILAFTHVDGYSLGTQFINMDLLHSDSHDPKSLNRSGGAQEAYLVYRNTLDIEKLTHQKIAFGAIKGAGITLGFDWNTKSDVGYNSRKRMLVWGGTLMWDVPGHLNTSLLFLHESNAPSGAFPPISNVSGRYHYKTHPMIALDWGIPMAPLVAFEGYANFIASKGKDEVGHDTGVETNIDSKVMFDMGSTLGYGKNVFRIGVEYQYWPNKFGNTAVTTGGNGFKARTPMVRVEYHF